MKKLLGCTLAAVCVISLASCDDKDSKSGDKNLSGEVNVYMPSPSTLNTKYIEAFEEQTGVEVKLYEGTTGKILAKLEAEKANPIADVIVLASWSDGLNFAVDNELISFEPKNYEKLYDGWYNTEKTLFGTSASALGVIYNTDAYQTLNADWDELASETYKGNLAIPDGTQSGSCKDFLAGYMYENNSDWSVWRNMAANGLTVAGANKAALDTVLSGEKGILVAGVDYNAYSKIAKGEAIQIYYPESGTVINPRPAMILKTSKNLDNAKAFVDFLLSDEAQKMVSSEYLLPGRSDILCTNRANVSEIKQFSIDWEWMRKNSNNITVELNALCGA